MIFKDILCLDVAHWCRSFQNSSKWPPRVQTELWLWPQLTRSVPEDTLFMSVCFFSSSSSSSSLLLFSVSQGERGLFYLIIKHFTNKIKLSLSLKNAHTHVHTHTHSCAAVCVKFRQRRRLTAKCRRRRLSRFTTAISWFIFITATVLGWTAVTD